MFAADLCIHRANKISNSALKVILSESYSWKINNNVLVDTRWSFFEFTVPVPEKETRSIDPCKYYLSSLLIIGVDDN